LRRKQDTHNAHLYPISYSIDGRCGRDARMYASGLPSTTRRIP
jgi:hypothetical protein